jgi:hypothetical protein
MFYKEAGMRKHLEYCPKCQGIRSTSISVSLKKVVNLGETYEVLNLNYHCNACLSFIRSADQDVPDCVEDGSRMPVMA